MTTPVSALAFEPLNTDIVRIAIRASRKVFLFMTVVSRFRVSSPNKDSFDFSPPMQLQEVFQKRPRGNAHAIVFERMKPIMRIAAT